MRRPRSGVHAAVLVAVVGGIYANSLAGDFHYDDDHSIVRNPAIRDLGKVPRYFVDPALFSGDPDKGMYRPLLLASYALNYAANGYDRRGWHLVNIGLHLAATLVLWRLAALLGAGPAAWWGALIFAVHPLATEPVDYVSSRSELMMGALVLGALAAHLRARRSGGGRWRWVAAGLYLCGLLTKATAIVAAPAMLALDLLLPGGGGAANRLRPLARRHGPYWVLAGAYLAVVVANGFLRHSLAAPVRGLGAQLSTQAKALGYYARLVAVPRPLSVDHAFVESAGVEAPVVGSLALVLSLGLVAAFAWRRCRPGLLALVWSALVLAPTCLVPLNVLVNERRLYLVVAAAAFVPVAGGLSRMRPWILALGLVLAILTVQRNPVWATASGLWTDAVRSGSRSYRAYVNLGKALQGEGRSAEALTAYQQALRLEDGHGDAYNNIAVLLHSDGRPAEAVPYYQAALARSPEMSEIHVNLAAAYDEVGQAERADSTYRDALGLDPDNGGLWNNYGEHLMDRRRAAAAAAAFARAAALLPGRHEPRNNLGNALSALGRPEEAVGAYRDALSKGPGGADRALILANLGETYMALHQVASARAVLDSSLRLAETVAGLDYRARIAFADGDLAAAADLWRRCLGLDPERAPALVGVGEVRLRSGDAVAAAAWFRKAVAAGGGTRARFGLAEALEATGDEQGARQAYAEVVAGGRSGDRRVRTAAERLRRPGGGGG